MLIKLEMRSADVELEMSCGTVLELLERRVGDGWGWAGGSHREGSRCGCLAHGSYELCAKVGARLEVGAGLDAKRLVLVLGSRPRDWYGVVEENITLIWCVGGVVVHLGNQCMFARDCLCQFGWCRSAHMNRHEPFSKNSKKTRKFKKLQAQP